MYRERQSGNGRQLCPCQCHWDLSFLRFGDTRIAPTDVDGMFVVHDSRRGRDRFLFIETKCPTESLGMGQEILLKALSRQRDFTVVILRGESGRPATVERVRNGNIEAAEHTSRADLQDRIDNWFYEASGLAPLPF